MRSPTWEIQKARREAAAMAAAAVVLAEGQHAAAEAVETGKDAGGVGRYIQLVEYVLRTAHGDAYPYTVAELREIVNSGPSLPAASRKAVDEHMQRVAGRTRRMA